MINWIKSQKTQERQTTRSMRKSIIIGIYFVLVLMFTTLSTALGGGDSVKTKNTAKKQSVNYQNTINALVADYMENENEINRLKQDMKRIVDEKNNMIKQLKNEIIHLTLQVNTLNIDAKQIITKGKNKIAEGKKEVVRGEEYLQRAEEASNKMKQTSNLLNLLKNIK